MKPLILLSLVLFVLVACKQEEKIAPNTTSLQSIAVIVVKPDTIPDKAGLNIKLFKDSVTSDETAIVFDHASSLDYVFNEDALYFPGFGKVGLASVANDGNDLAINRLPFISGMSIGLDVHAKTDGTYFLKISYDSKIPADVQIWVKDNYLKDSIDVRSRNYSFNVVKADTNSFGRNRFKLILKNSGQ